MKISTKKDYIIFLIVLSVISTVIVLTLAFLKRSENRKNYADVQKYICSENYEEALNILEKLGDYKDSAALRKEAENGKTYLEANELLMKEEYAEAIDKFTEAEGFKDSKEKINEANYCMALDYYDKKDYDNAKKIFSALGEYENSKLYLARIEVESIEQSQETIYEEACLQAEKNNYNEAISLFENIVDYKDSKEHIEMCKVQLKRMSLNNNLSAGVRYSVAIKDDGHVEAVGRNEEEQCEVKRWEDIISIDAYGCLTIGLKETGEVEVAGICDGRRINDIENWKEITDVAAGERFIVGLKRGGTLVADGHGDDGQLNVTDWENVIAIDAGWSFTVALTEDRELLFAGIDNGQETKFQEHKDEWKDVVNISASGGGRNSDCRGKGHTVGLKSDGTVVAIGDNTYGQCDVSEWSDIVKIATGDWYTVGLRADGTVLITGENFPGSRYINEDELKKCTDIVDIAAGFGQTICLKEDGTIIAFGFDDDYKCSGTLKWENLMIPEY